MENKRKLINISLTPSTIKKIERLVSNNKGKLKTRKNTIEKALVMSMGLLNSKTITNDFFIHYEGLESDYKAIKKVLESNPTETSLNISLVKHKLSLCYKPTTFIKYWKLKHNSNINSYSIGTLNGVDTLFIKINKR